MTGKRRIIKYPGAKWRMAMVMHPDQGGDEAAFVALKENYEACLERMGKE